VPSPAAFPFAHELRPGDTYAPLRFAITAEVNQQFCFALEDFAPEYVPREGRPAQVHPVLLLHMSARTRSPSFRLAPGMGSVFAKDRVSFRSPAYVDDPLEVQWTLRDVYARKGRLYQALQTRVLDANGKLVIEREAHSVFFTRSGEPLAVPRP
jgi:hypothetical protein